MSAPVGSWNPPAVTAVPVRGRRLRLRRRRGARVAPLAPSAAASTATGPAAASASFAGSAERAEEDDALAHYIHEKVPAELQHLIYVFEAVINDTDWRSELIARRQFFEKAIFGFLPKFWDIGKFFAVDNYQ